MTPEQLLAQYISTPDSNVFCLQNLPQEVRAVLFAYYSRSSKSLKDILLEMLQSNADYIPSVSDEVPQELQATAAAFHEKWVVGYGHGSVAEHAVLNIGIENVSILATKVIEDNRLASYTEKSTRYVVFDADSYYKAPELSGTQFEARYHELMMKLMASYNQVVDTLEQKFRLDIPRNEKQSSNAYNTMIKGKACDVARYILPTAALTNLGLTINARALEHMLQKLLSHPLAEIRKLGEDIKAQAVTICPTLIKYASENRYLQESSMDIGELQATPVQAQSRHIFTGDPIKDIAYAILYKKTDCSLSELEVLNDVNEMMRIIGEYVKDRGQHDAFPREFETAQCLSEIVIDYGAFRDIQRHRMSTQLDKPLNPSYGYVEPYGFELFNETEKVTYHELMLEAGALAQEMIAAGLPIIAQYCLPMAYNKRVLFQWNLREVAHFIELRSRKQGHMSYRSMAQEMWAQLHQQQPNLMELVRVDNS